MIGMAIRAILPKGEHDIRPKNAHDLCDLLHENMRIKRLESAITIIEAHDMADAEMGAGAMEFSYTR
jgi:hypothetical protein